MISEYLIPLAIGIIAGALAVWFGSRKKDTSSVILHKKISAKDHLLNDLSDKVSRLDSEHKLLHQKIIDESVKRSSAEKECEQIPKLENTLTERKQQISELLQTTNRHTALIAELETTLLKEREQTSEKLQLIEESKEAMSLQFKDIANKILDEKSKKFTAQNAENLDSILKPLGEKIKDFEKKITETNKSNYEERLDLNNHIKTLTGLNNQLSADAHNLTIALKGESKTQGNWGELILERILEASGLTNGLEYTTQKSMKAEDGKRYLPDVVINLPENKHIIIDSKVSLTAYESYCAAETDAERAKSLNSHIASIKKHVKELSDKNYHDLPEVKSIDFVLMFIPVEPAYGLAVQTEADIFFEAFSKNIVIVTPSSLIATLRTIAYIWRQEAQNKNATTIAIKAGQLYDKFTNFVTDMESIGKKIEQTQGSYDDAMKKLKNGTGNLVRRTEELKKLGAQTNKQLELDESEED